MLKLSYILSLCIITYAMHVNQLFQSEGQPFAVSSEFFNHYELLPILHIIHEQNPGEIYIMNIRQNDSDHIESNYFRVHSLYLNTTCFDQQIIGYFMIFHFNHMQFVQGAITMPPFEPIGPSAFIDQQDRIIYYFSKKHHAFYKIRYDDWVLEKRNDLNFEMWSTSQLDVLRINSSVFEIVEIVRMNSSHYVLKFLVKIPTFNHAEFDSRFNIFVTKRKLCMQNRNGEVYMLRAGVLAKLEFKAKQSHDFLCYLNNVYVRDSSTQILYSLIDFKLTQLTSCEILLFVGGGVALIRDLNKNYIALNMLTGQLFEFSMNQVFGDFSVNYSLDFTIFGISLREEHLNAIFGTQFVIERKQKMESSEILAIPEDWCAEDQD